MPAHISVRAFGRQTAIACRRSRGGLVSAALAMEEALPAAVVVNLR
jgi:hypothetical protein